VRMLRAVALACRLDFTIDRDTREAIQSLRGEIVKSSAARLLEEVYKILRQGRARETFLDLHRHGLLAYLMPEAARSLDDGRSSLLESLGRLDAYRASGTPAEALTNPLLVGTLLVPLGAPLRRAHGPSPRRRPSEEGEEPEEGTDEVLDVAAEAEALGEQEAEPEDRQPVVNVPLSLPYARRDLDRLRLLLLAQRKLHEVHRTPGVKHVVGGRPYLEEALRWLEIHGGEGAFELVGHWRGLDLSHPLPEAASPGREGGRSRRHEGGPAGREGHTASDEARAAAGAPPGGEGGHRPRRRRRRRRRRPRPSTAPPV
jgi:hypothetical protein